MFCNGARLVATVPAPLSKDAKREPP